MKKRCQSNVRIAETAIIDFLLKFLGLYVLLVSVLAVLIAGGYVSVLPRVTSRNLKGFSYLNVDQFHALLNKKGYQLPESLSAHVGRKGTYRMFNLATPKQGTKWYRTPLRVFNGVTGELALKQADDDAILNEEHYLLRYLGVEPDSEEARQESTFSVLDDDTLQYLIWNNSCLLIRERLGANISEGGGPLQELRQAVDGIADATLRREFWKGFVIAEQTFTPIIIWNPTNLTAKEVDVFLDDTRAYYISPVSLMSESSLEFTYNKGTNTIRIRQLLPQQSIFLLVQAYREIKPDRVKLTWERYSEVNGKYLGVIMIFLFIACILVFAWDWARKSFA